MAKNVGVKLVESNKFYNKFNTKTTLKRSLLSIRSGVRFPSESPLNSQSFHNTYLSNPHSDQLYFLVQKKYSETNFLCSRPPLIGGKLVESSYCCLGGATTS